MIKPLSELQEILISGQRLSMQGSLDRRSPDKRAILFLLEARKGLKEYVKINPNDSSAWRFLSQAEECLLNYREALECLKTAINLSPQDKKDMKRMALLKEYELKWKDLILSSEQINLLNAYLEQKLQETPCEHNLKITKEWLEKNVQSDKTKIIKAL